MNDASSTTERVGRYQLLEPMGSGPSGAVSRAKVFGVAGFERQFAVKRFVPELTVLPMMAQSLSAAARSYGSLEHPRIARMTEFGIAQGTTFTAVELVTGLDAMRLMTEAKASGGTLASGGVLALVSQAARAVGYAHGRGLTHLGLSPTNIIITPDGDVKVTDFGILAATMPARPAEVGRLANRLGYLAPEQLAGEGTSAATDVFVLGVIAHELVTCQRAFRGDTPQQVAQAILAGPPADPALPRPIVRVLQRCLARSQFERFPDARALADALDAALRVAPVPGTRKDIGGQVKAMLDRLAQLNEGQLSGIVSLNLGTGPLRPIEQDLARTLPPPIPREPAPSLTLKDMPAPMTTVTGLAPPPIPVPAGAIAGSPPPPTPAVPIAAARRQVPQVPSVIPSIKPKVNAPAPEPPPQRRAGTPPPIPIVEPKPDAVPVLELVPIESTASSRGATTEHDTVEKPAVGLDHDIFHSVTREGGAIQLPRGETLDATTTLTGVAPARAESPVFRDLPKESPEGPREARTMEMEPMLARELERAIQLPTGELPALVVDGSRKDPLAGFAQELEVPTIANVPTSAVRSADQPVPRLEIPSAQPRQEDLPTALIDKPLRRKRSRWPLALLGLIVVGGGGAAAWLMIGDHGGGAGPVDPPKHGSDVVAVVKGSGVPRPADAATGSDVVPVGSNPPVGSGSGSGSGSATPDPVKSAGSDAVGENPVKPVGASDALQIASTPSGARVFIDGADQGTTPVKLAGSADRHTVALLLAGHDLYVAEVDGHGQFKLELKPVTPTGGPAGIKVIKCQKDRYYVFVDGNPTGMTCPTERIDCATGPHTVEVYDVVTETRRKWDINVADTRLSYRVRVE